MIPDKIYIRHYWMPGELDDEWRLKPAEDEQCEEYIRKDVIMEWAKEGKEHYKKLMEDFPDETSFAALFGVYNGFIEKLNSL